MTGEHLKEPLDYLYEELPPDRMAEAREHLSRCPQCRENLRRIREAVKAYRRAPKPAPPPGLGRRAAALALALRHAEGPDHGNDVAAFAAEPVAAPAPLLPAKVPGAEGAVDPEFARLKNEILAEMRRDWRSWLYHPAWTVAASIIFIFTLLVHFAPRRQGMVESPVPASAPAAASAARPAQAQARVKISLPATTPPEELARASVPPASPILSEAEARRQEPPPPAPAVNGLLAAKEEPEMAMADAPPPSPAPVPAPSPPAAVAPESPVADNSVAANFQAVQQAAPRAARPAAPSFAAAPKAEWAKQPPPPASLRPPAIPLPDEAAAAMDMLSISAQSAAGSAMMAGDADVAAGEAEAVLEAAEPLEDAGTALATASPPEAVIVNLLPDMEPPQLIRRPTPIDTEKLARDLIALAGMQIGHGELEDARIAVGMLRKYDPAKAEELTRLIAALEAAAEAETKAEADAAAEAGPEAPTEPEPAAPPPDKYFTPEEDAVHTSSAANERPAEETPAEDGDSKEGVTAIEAASEEETGGGREGDAATDPVESPQPEPAIPEARPEPEQAEAEETATPIIAVEPMEVYIGPVYSAYSPPPPFPEAAEAVSVPEPPAVSPSGAGGPMPPTLWESGPGRRGRGGAPVFSTDPYVREDW